MKHSTTDETSSGNVRRERLSVVVLVAGGLISLLISLLLLRDVALSWEEMSWLDRLMASPLVLSFFGVSIAMLLSPLRRVKVFGFIIKLALWPLEITGILYHYYVFATVPILVLILVPLVAWSAFRAVGWIPVGAEQTLMYSLLIGWAFVFTAWGRRITELVLVKGMREDYSRLLSLLEPSLVRVYIYAIMAVTYIFANVEKFLNTTLTSFQFWATYKEVLVEVLLTYVAVDSLMVAWREHKDKTSR
jgi:hypothetical protein